MNLKDFACKEKKIENQFGDRYESICSCLQFHCSRLNSQAYQARVVSPFSVDIKFVLMLSFWQVYDSDKVTMALDHR